MRASTTLAGVLLIAEMNVLSPSLLTERITFIIYMDVIYFIIYISKVKVES